MAKSISELSSSQKADIKKSWDEVKKNPSDHGAEFFKKLFTDFAYTEERFPDFKGKSVGELKTDKMMRAHSVAVLAGISTFVDSINDDQLFDGLVRKMTISHDKRNVGPKDFVNAAVTLVKYLDAKGDLKTAWEKFWEIWASISEDAKQKSCKK